MTQDTMTQHHQKFYELLTSSGQVWLRTTSRTKAAAWHATSQQQRAQSGPGTPCPRVVPSMDVWFSSPNSDAAALAQWDADRDRRWGL